MSLILFGANYKTVSFDELGRIALPKDEVSAANGMLAALEGVNGVAALSTCNRVELYVDTTVDEAGVRACRDFFLHRGAREISGYYHERGEAVASHLFNVACSLDSQVLGEPQILGQVKTAFADASEAGTCTEILVRLFKDALSVGKRVRSETAIGRDSVSLSTAAFKAAAREFGDIAGCRVVLVGAGEMARLALAYLLEAGVSDITVTSRALEHAQELARSCEGSAVPFEQRYQVLATADVAFTLTSSSEPVVEADRLDRARLEQGVCGRKLVIIDGAVPRDVQVECAQVDGVVLYDVQDLGNIVDESMATRKDAVAEVRRMVSQAESDFLAWMKQRSVTPTVRAMYAKGEATVAGELERAVKSLEAQRGGCALSAEERDVLEAYGTAIMKKILHGPTARLRREAGTAEGERYTSAARFLFGLDAYPPGSVPPHACMDGACPGGETQEKGATPCHARLS